MDIITIITTKITIIQRSLSQSHDLLRTHQSLTKFQRRKQKVGNPTNNSGIDIPTRFRINKRIDLFFAVC